MLVAISLWIVSSCLFHPLALSESEIMKRVHGCDARHMVYKSTDQLQQSAAKTIRCMVYKNKRR